MIFLSDKKSTESWRIMFSIMWHHIQSTNQYIIPAREVIDAHAQEFVANNELLLPILRAFAECTSSTHATPNAWYFQPLSTRREVCRTYQYQSSRGPI